MNPCIPVPSPQQILSALFPNGVPQVPKLPTAWTGTAILTPFGGGSGSIQPIDQLAVANLSYESVAANENYLRCRFYLLESLSYFDFIFRTLSGATSWWWIGSDPGDPIGTVIKAAGPFSSSAQVPTPDFLLANNFKAVGSWDRHGRLHNASSGRNRAQAGTWYLFDALSGGLGRVMNVDAVNDFGVPVLGAYYLVEFSGFEANVSSNLAGTVLGLPSSPAASGTASPMLTQADLLSAMANPPAGFSTVPCTLAQIQSLIPGIAQPTSSVPVPSWTNRVNSVCYMIGQDTYPYYCQLWYDWDEGTQITVFVFQDANGHYTIRQDERLPKGSVGPSVDYSWDGSKWNPDCYTAGGGDVPMPVPGFVQAGGGRCRAVISNDPVFGSVSIWTVQLGGAGSWADFWYWFTDSQKGVIFSLAPASSLTIIDYQTFIQNGVIQKCVFDDPSSGISACPTNQLSAEKKQKRMFSVK